MLTDALWQLNRLAEAVERGRPVLAELVAAGLAGSSADGLAWNVATSLLELGRLDEVPEILAPLLREPPDESNSAAFRVHSRSLRLYGRVDEAAQIIDQLHDVGADEPGAVGDIDRTVEAAEFALARGEPHRVPPLMTAAFERAAGTSAEWQLAELAWLGARAGADIAVTSRRLGRPDRAAQAVETLERLATELPAAARQPGPEGLGVAVRGFAASLTAEAARARGGDATASWRAAVLVWQDLNRRLHELYCSFRLAEALAQVARGREAQDVAADVYRAAAEMRLRPLCDDLAALARRQRLSLQPASAPGGPLTARELEILTLIAAGRSNQQIAAELFLSASTVRVHVTHILRKLQVTTRTGAAAAAYRRGLLPGNIT
jgi:DNA-binding CsgD family transcriptional regulator